MSKSICHRAIRPYYSKFSRVPSSDGSIIASTGQYVEYSAKESVFSDDYSLGNLIAIGAVDKLQYVSMSLNSDMNFVDEFAKSYKTIASDVQ